MRNWFWLSGLLALLFFGGISQDVEVAPPVADLSATAERSATMAAAAEERPAAVMLEPQGFIQRVHDPVLAFAAEPADTVAARI